MASEKQSRSKTQTLSIRLDPKTRFILEFMSRIRGQSITVVVERAIKEAAGKAGIGPTEDRHGSSIAQNTWEDFWDPDESVRTLQLLADRNYPTTYEEDEIRRFTVDHSEFFYTNSSSNVVKRHSANILWPKLPDYIKLWQSTRVTDYWVTGQLMAEDLTKAGISPPEWPHHNTPAETKKSDASKGFVRDLDDEVPF